MSRSAVDPCGLAPAMVRSMVKAGAPRRTVAAASAAIYSAALQHLDISKYDVKAVAVQGTTDGTGVSDQCSGRRAYLRRKRVARKARAKSSMNNPISSDGNVAVQASGSNVESLPMEAEQGEPGWLAADVASPEPLNTKRAVAPSFSERKVVCCNELRRVAPICWCVPLARPTVCLRVVLVLRIVLA